MGYHQHTRGPSVDSSTFAVPDNGDYDELADGSESLSSYAGSGEDLTDEEASPVSYLDEAFANAFDPNKLDRAIAIQAQTSGLLNAKSKEIQNLQAEVVERLNELKTVFAEGMKNAKNVQKDLDWIHKRVKQLSREAKAKYPIEYTKAKEEQESNGY
jgi:hypothetical protein